MDKIAKGKKIIITMALLKKLKASSDLKHYIEWYGSEDLNQLIQKMVWDQQFEYADWLVQKLMTQEQRIDYIAYVATNLIHCDHKSYYNSYQHILRFALIMLCGRYTEVPYHILVRNKSNKDQWQSLKQSLEVKE